MNMRSWVAASLGMCLLCFGPRFAGAEENSCPSTSDVPYVARDDDTLSDIALRFYCVEEEPQLSRVWTALYAYNRARIGPDPHKLSSNTLVCLPPRAADGTWKVDRCAGAQQPEPQVSVTACPAPVAPERSPRCIVIVRPSPQTPPKEPDQPKRSEPIRPRVIAIDVAGGASLPLSSWTRSHVYRSLVLAGIDARIAVGWAEVTPRLLFVGGRHGTVFNNVGQPQTIFGGGASVSVGVPLAFGPVYVTPGIDVGWLYVRRDIDRPATFANADDELHRHQAGHMPFVGAFVRPEVPIPKSHIRVAAEFGSDLLLASLAGSNITNNFNAKLMGVVGYAF